MAQLATILEHAKLAPPRSRQGYIGGSDIASILGVSPWKTAYELWEEKTSGWVEATTEAREKVLNRGKKLEPIVLEMLQEEKDVWILDRNQIHVDPEHAFLTAEIDYEYVVDHDLVEKVERDEDTGYQPGFYEIANRHRTVIANIGNGDVKTVHPFAAKDWGEEGTDGFPVYYCAQFQFGLMVTGRQVCMVAALIGADDLRVYEVRRDEDLIALIREKAVNFWFENIVKLVPPPVQTAEDAVKILRKFQGFVVEADPETIREVAVIKGIKEAEKRLCKKREDLELSVKTKLVIAAEYGASPGEPGNLAILGPDKRKPLLTWNQQTVSRVSQERLKTEFPSVYQQVLEPSTFRVLRVK